MKDLLVYILKNITTVPDDINIEESTVDGVINFTITANSDDIGRIIGRDGKIIKAIRTIMRVVAIQNDQRVRVTVISDTDREEPVQQEVEMEAQEDTENIEEPTVEQTENSQEESLEVESQEDSIEVDL